MQEARRSLVIPKKKPIDELIKSRNMVKTALLFNYLRRNIQKKANLTFIVLLQKSLSPNLSEDLAISFYLQSHKLIIAVYQLINVQGTMGFDSCQAETSVNWLNQVLLMLSNALQLSQELKDKVIIQ